MGNHYFHQSCERNGFMGNHYYLQSCERNGFMGNHYFHQSCERNGEPWFPFFGVNKPMWYNPTYVYSSLSLLGWWNLIDHAIRNLENDPLKHIFPNRKHKQFSIPNISDHMVEKMWFMGQRMFPLLFRTIPHMKCWTMIIPICFHWVGNPFPKYDVYRQVNKKTKEIQIHKYKIDGKPKGGKHIIHIYIYIYNH